MINGILARSDDGGEEGLGRYGASIRLGRSLWQSADLPDDVRQRIAEPTFREGTFPTRDKIKTAFAKLKATENVRPMPFANATLASMKLSVDLYGTRIEAWFAAVAREKEPPTQEQWQVLDRIKDRVLVEYSIEKEGMRRDDPARDADEEPLRGLVHGPQGQGKAH
jgi:hypothetical protein